MLYPWHEIFKNSDEIRQGDFIPDCPIVIPPNNLLNDLNDEGLSLDVKTLNAIVMSQSCDLENDKIEIVLVCPYYTLEYFFENLLQSDRAGRGRTKKLEALKQGNLPAYHLLNKDLNNEINSFLVVDFKNVYGVSFEFLKMHLSRVPFRQRLLPPYREHLSQAFARFFMRAGLPNDIVDLA